MELKERISAFVKLGDRLRTLSHDEKLHLYDQAAQFNPWFTKDSIDLALGGISVFLQEETLSEWTSRYALHTPVPKKVGVAMAGNIPLVGFHDFMCVLISGHTLVAKLSSQDHYLMTWIRDHLLSISPRFADRIVFTERLNHVDAVLATGSDNTSRYFEYYFRNIPHIIRKNRSSCAVLMGEESEAHLFELGKDVFSYFGLGCRNVSKLFVPEGYDLTVILQQWEPYQPIANHHKYANNYDYQKAILLVNGTPFLDNGFVLFTQHENLVSPISVVYHETYKNLNDLTEKLEVHREKIQCVVSANGWWKESVPIGKAQMPEVWDYADQSDTLKFLVQLG